jgi:hypothetical protein
MNSVHKKVGGKSFVGSLDMTFVLCFNYYLICLLLFVGY